MEQERINIAALNAEAVIIDDCGYSVLGVLRGLSEKGIPTTLMCPYVFSPNRFSRFGKKLNCPAPEKEAEFIDSLVQYGKESHRRLVLFVANDPIALVISKYRGVLEKFYIFPMPPFEIMDKFINKKKFYRLLEEKNIPYPKTFYPGSLEGLGLIIKEVNFPCILKPVYSHEFRDFFVKCLKVESENELYGKFKLAMSRKIDALVQQIIPGGDIYTFYTYINREFTPLIICGYKKLRQLPVDFGIGTFCESFMDDELNRVGIELLQDMRYYGIAEIEFKRDPQDGIYKILDINVRVTKQNRLIAYSVFDAEYLAFFDSLGIAMEKKSRSIEGIKWICLWEDLLACFAPNGYIAQGKISIKEWLVSLKGRMVFACFSFKDILPFVIDSLRFILERFFFLKKRLLKGISSKR